jgi:hypothetical protein
MQKLRGDNSSAGYLKNTVIGINISKQWLLNDKGISRKLDDDSEWLQQRLISKKPFKDITWGSWICFPKQANTVKNLQALAVNT